MVLKKNINVHNWTKKNVHNQTKKEVLIVDDTKKIEKQVYENRKKDNRS